MLRRYCPLASGSKGNAIYVETDEVKLLFDAGLSFKMLREKLALIDVDPSDLHAVIISHEHSDHIRGLKTLISRTGIPILANAETAKAIYDSFGFCPRFKIFSTGETFEYGGLAVHPFSIPHDARDPVAFTLTSGETKLGICTDLGFVTTLVRQALDRVTHLVLEANHHPPMVHASPRPQSLKQRILGRTGHLSNEACGQLLRELHHTSLKHVHLAHLSEDCNTHETALTIVQEQLDKRETRVVVAPQHEIGEEVTVSVESASTV